MSWRALDGVFFLRPLLLVPVWTTYLLGFGRPPAYWPLAGELWPGLGAISAACAAAFVINQIFDMEGDRHNGKCPFLSEGAFTKRTAWGIYGVLCATALALCLAHVALWPPVVCVLALGALYSAPPWRWKDRPYLALLSNLLAHGVAVFVCGRLAAGARLGASLGPCLPYAFGAAAAYLLTTVPDRSGDAVSGKQTLAVTLGPERAARWALGWYLSAVLLALYQADLLFLLGVLPSGYWFAKAGRGDLAAVPTAVRASVLGLSVAAALLHPWYVLILITGWFATRAYYAKRWQFTYP